MEGTNMIKAMKHFTFTPDFIRECVLYCHVAGASCDPDECPLCKEARRQGSEHCIDIINFGKYNAGYDNELLIQRIIDDKCDLLYVDLLKVKELSDGKEDKNQKAYS